MRNVVTPIRGRSMLELKSVRADKASMVSRVRPQDLRRARRHERERGQALVEFALIAPLFLLIVVGIIQFGVGLNYWLDMNRIANQGARWAVVNKYPHPNPGDPCWGAPGSVCTNPNLQEYLASEAVSGGLNPCVVISFPATTSNVGDPVKVELTIPFSFSPIVNLWTFRLKAEATMRLEQMPTRYAAGLGGTTC
jgi:TadE-like protein